MMKELDSEEISELMAYDRHVQPLFNPHWYFGMLASTICNMLSSKDAPRRTPQDFMLKYVTAEDDDEVEARNMAVLDAKIARQNASK